MYAGIPIVACEFKVVLYSVYQDFISNSRYLDILTSIFTLYLVFEAFIFVLRLVLALVVGLLPVVSRGLPWQHVLAAVDIDHFPAVGVQ